jgi:hypothetical protein
MFNDHRSYNMMLCSWDPSMAEWESAVTTYGPMYPAPSEMRHRCAYCGSLSTLDKRGNCCACGAPIGDDYDR